MSRRSVMNDRYRVERSGKTRKSASAAKPKRAAGEAATAAPKKSAAKPKSALARMFGGGGTSAASVRIEPSPLMRKLRRVWWILMAVAILLALAMVQTSKLKNPVVDRVVLGGYVLALGGALYLEFGPLRRARVEAAAAAKSGKKVGGAPAPKASPASAAAVTPAEPAGLRGFVKGLIKGKKTDGEHDAHVG